MLVLSRKPQESIWIGENIQIVVCSIQGNRVRLGIQAPKSVAVRRDELIDAQQTPSDDVIAIEGLGSGFELVIESNCPVASA